MNFKSIFQILFFILSTQLVSCQSYKQGLFPIVSFPHSANLYSNNFVNDYNLTFYWNITNPTTDNATNITNPTTDNATLYGAFILTTRVGSGVLLSKSWIGIGFGSSMLESEMIVCHNGNQAQANLESPVSIHEHFSTSTYSVPPHSYDIGYSTIMVPITGQGTALYHTCLFKRVVNPRDGIHLDLTPALNSSINMIWAFNPASGKNYLQQYMTHHATNQRGAVSINLGTGQFEVASVDSFNLKVVHGYGMMFFWLFMFPLGAYYARFFRSVPHWMIMKAIVQSTAVVGILIMVIVVVGGSSAKIRTRHAVFGIVLMVIVGLQAALGVLNMLAFSREKLYEYKKWIRMFHLFTGYSLLALCIPQIALGINILYPWIEPRDITAWVLLFVLVGGWILVFIITWVYFDFKVYLSDGGYKKVPTQKHGHHSPADVKPHSKEVTEVEKCQPRYNWQLIDREIHDGKMLVVGNGKYVYDISKWIHSHPGGQIILQNVNGTDISNDYFHESGFDADEFAQGSKNQVTGPVKRAALSAANASIPGLSLADMVSVQTMAEKNGIDLSTYQVTITAPLITPEDWKFILRSRRTHVHTRLAMERLSHLIVGELDTSESTGSLMRGSHVTLDPTDEPRAGEKMFDIFEYRRYALTGHTIESASNATRAVLRLRFCLLYPFDARVGQPDFFVPGQAIEIQVRLANGQRVTRYYTPISGNLNAFEMLVRVKPQGKMSEFLLHAATGERQFKIRGPFGSPLLSTEMSLRPTITCDYNTIYFFAGGSGITPALSILNSLYLSTNTNLYAAMPYQATLSDELDVNIGDVLTIFRHYYDGWCFGMNHTTNQSGSFPVACAYPVSTTRMVLVILSDLTVDVMGSEVVQGAQLAYPSLIQIERYNSITLTSDKVAQVIDLENRDQNSKCIVCGPPGMTARICDMLDAFGKSWAENVIVLNSERPN